MNAQAMPSTWSPQQEKAISEVRQWLRNPSGQQVFRLFGFAGTGKTTLAREIAGDAAGKPLFAAFTGKAAQVLRQKGCSNASTIHSMIYEPKQRADGTVKFSKRPRDQFVGVPLIVIDECSMVGEDLAADLLSYGIPVLVLGDPAQLPPVKGAGVFTDHKPDFMLTEVHRQAAENPIIALSMEVREGRKLVAGDFGEVQIIHRDNVNPDAVTAADQVLCGLNRTRSNYNRRLRQIAGRLGEIPEAGDRLVCLKNNADLGIFNGSIGSVTRIASAGPDAHVITIEIEGLGGAVECPVLNACWDGSISEVHWSERRNFDEFTFGYALTVHKSQGSQWPEVYLFDESSAFREDARRHLYTGITRAAERLTIVL